MTTTNKAYIDTMNTIKVIMEGYKNTLNQSRPFSKRFLLSSSVKDIPMKTIFDIYNSLKNSEEIKLMFPTEFMESNYVIIYKVASDCFIYIESEKVYPIKIQKINYN